VPTLSDWADHLTTIFPEARIKKFIEMRGADGGPWRRLCALPAFWVGLTYDQTALDAAWDLVKDWDAETREALRVAASVHALDAKVGRIDMHDLAREVLAIAEAGLEGAGAPGRGRSGPRRDAFPGGAQGQRRDGQGARRRVAGALPRRLGGRSDADLRRVQLLRRPGSDASRRFRAFDRRKHAGAVVVLKLFLAAVGDHAAELLVHFLDQRGWLDSRGGRFGIGSGPKRLLPCVPGRQSTT
jgi:hypothetical protein